MSKKISELTLMGPLTGDEEIPGVQTGVTLKLTPNLLLAFLQTQQVMSYQGQADASAIDEDAATGTSVFNNGDVYRVNVAATAPHAFSDIAEDLAAGDWVVYNGATWDKQDGTDPSAAETKAAYESNANTNAFTDAEQTKLGNLDAGAEPNTIDSDPGGITGAAQIINAVSISQANFDAIGTPQAATLYVIDS